MVYTFAFVVINIFGNLFVNSTNTIITLSHNVHDRPIGRYGVFVRDRFVPQVWGLVPLGYINSPHIPHQSPGIVGRAYH